MATSSDIIKEFLVSLGWSHDEQSRKKVVAAEQKTTKEIEKESKTREGYAKKARESLDQTVKAFAGYALAAEAMAVGVVAAVEKMASSFEKAYYSSARTGATVKQLNAFQYAASQMGSSAEEAQSAVEGLAKAQRSMPGFASMLRGLGATDPSNLVKSLNEIAPALAKMPLAAAEARAKVLGIPENLLLAMRQVDEFRRQEEESNKKYSFLGFDAQKAAADGKALTQLFRSLFDTVDKLTQAIGSKLFVDLKEPIENLNAYLLAHGKEITDTVVKIADAFAKMLIYLVEHLPDLNKFAGMVGGWNNALGVLATIVSAAFVGRILSLFGALRGLSLLTMPPWALGVLGVGAAAAATVAEVNRPYGNPDAYRGSGIVGLRKHQHDREEDAGGPWGTVKRFWKQNAPTWAGGDKPSPVSNEGNYHNLTDLTEQAAKEAGIDPRIMHGIRSGESGHGSKYDVGDGGSSFGPWQLHYGGINPAMPHPGLGDQFTKETGLDARDPKTLPAQTRWVAKWLRTHSPVGTWFGYHGNRDASPRWGDSGYVPDPIKKAPATNSDWQSHRGGKVPMPPLFGGVGLNADKLRSQMMGGNVPPLGGDAANNSKNVTIQQTNHNHVTGVSDPTAAAAQIGARQDRHSSQLLRSMQSAVV